MSALIDTVLLDMGGVLLEMRSSGGLPDGRLDWRGRQALLELLRHDGARLELEDLETLLFAPWRRQYEHRYETLRDADFSPHLAQLRRRTGSRRSDLELLAAWFRPYGDSLAPIAGAVEALAALTAAGFRLALVSNVPLPGELYRRLLERHGLAAPFADLRFSYDEGCRKPSPRLLAAALEAVGGKPETAVMVGDRRATDVAGGRAVGCRTVWIRSSHRQGPAADREIEALAELPQLLAHWEAEHPPAPAAAGEPPPAVPDAAALMRHFRRQRRWTRELVWAIPEERFDWAPAGETFTLGGLVRHLIQAEIFWVKLLVAASRGERYDPFRLHGPAAEKLERFRTRNLDGSADERYGATFAQCLEAWAAIQAKSERRLGRLSRQQLGLRVEHPLTGLAAPVWEMILVMIEHEAHHRGQLSAFLKVLELPQPAVVGTP